MAYHPQILELDDHGLCRALVLLSRHRLSSELTLTPWEREFIDKTPGWWAREGFITWKQRRSARRILSNATGELERRAELGRWIEEAKSID